MANFNPVRVNLTDLETTAIIDGQLLFVTDQDNGKNGIYIDVGNTRKQIGIFDWSEILNKPFNSIGDGLTVTNNVLEGDSRWNMITNKPFETIGDGLIVINDELRTDIEWTEVTNKPFETIGSGLSVINNALTADVQSWNIINNKPFNTIGAGLAVNNGALVATGGGTGVDWSTEIINKPFETIGSGLKVENGTLETDITLSWSNVTNKPFDSIGSGLSVNSNNELITSYTWSDITSKPFATIGNGLTVVNNELTLDTITWSGVTSKPFTTVGNGLTVDGNEALNADIQTITAPISGTATSSTYARQTFTVNGTTNTEISGTKYMQLTQNLSTSGTTTFTFENSDITTSSVIDIFASIYGIIPQSVTTTNGRVDIVFPRQSAANSMTCRIYIR